MVKHKVPDTSYLAKCFSQTVRPLLESTSLQGDTVVKKKRKLFQGSHLTSPRYRNVAIHLDNSYSIDTRILTRFPFALHTTLSVFLFLVLPKNLGSIHPCANKVRMEPFPTSVFKALTGIFATTTKI